MKQACDCLSRQKAKDQAPNGQTYIIQNREMKEIRKKDNSSSTKKM